MTSGPNQMSQPWKDWSKDIQANSIHLKEKLKCELKKMEKQGVIRKVSEHTDWCSSLAYSMKKDGSLRICIDPQKLNQALKRCPHKVPTLKELNPQFAGSTVFSKLDAKDWSVHLDPDSQLITTFWTPFGRYCWTRLAFGLRVSQDIFQARMDEILEDLTGVVGITDDVCVHGKDEEEHDRNLKALMDRAKETGLVFNSDKCTIRQPEISFFGNIYSKDGIRPDPAKVHDIRTCLFHRTKRICRDSSVWWHTSQHSFPTSVKNHNHSGTSWRRTSHLRCRKTTSTASRNSKQQSQQSRVSNTLTQKKPNHTTLEVDSSTKGLGATILQDGQPVAFTSKALNSAQSNYPNIDREMLAVVFGINRFYTYMYGRPFRVITDHKPLEMISKKPLLRAPPRLQTMLQKIQGYDFTIEYRQGKTMTLADTLSRLPNPKDKGAVELDLRVDGIEMTTA